jgi:hypothetical protein
MSRSTATVLAAVGLAILAAGARLEATTVVRMDAAELADEADLVFTGTALRKSVVLSKNGTYPFTFVTFAVEDALKGGTIWREITLRFDGGSLGNSGLTIHGMPEFAEGETYLLFVRGNGSAMCPVVGWFQGQYRYTTERGSRKRILVDSAGVPLQGVDGGRFQRAWKTPVSRGARVVSVEEVTLQHVADAAAEVPDAERVVSALRSFIAGRAQARTFRPGLMVESARPEDVSARGARKEPGHDR